MGKVTVSLNRAIKIKTIKNNDDDGNLKIKNNKVPAK